ncbi:acyl-CoA reductase [Algoriphagus aestuariicola]|uniref:Acyl-CoA reductase n=1 Tax=Algoriphagus aestuariicola TaxID=1852016 RepID=A0ABS3BSU6_9BACT|nr:acyl-CoA reductase [Algoriphagus aestuariicola]MBN7801336.1 acyl-CoA reductase [Algoriphagus aestuariicola]
MTQGLPPQKRIQAFSDLGILIKNLDAEEKALLFRRASNQNSWFTDISMEAALSGLAELLDVENLKEWLVSYSIPERNNPKKVGILMAGNIPGVGFHDLMCVLISGNIAVVKLSSSDSIFSKWLIDRLIQLEPLFEEYIQIQEMLKGMDAYIATGSDNSARYFNYYFGKYPSIIRANRTSVGVLTGEETDDEIEQLGKDIFLYFGLGCRNVSKIYVKDPEQLQRLFGILERFSWVAQNHKYLNNYEYNKSIYLVNGDPHLDNGFLLLKESSELVSPIAVLFYEVYESREDLKGKLDVSSPKIQCIVGDPNVVPQAVGFGRAQYPKPWDYADGVDTMKFLLGLNQDN